MRRRPADEERHPDRLLVHEALVEEAVVAEEEPLVARVHDDRVLGEARLLEVREHLADAVVHRLDGRQVVLHVALVLPSPEGFARQGHALAVTNRRDQVRLDRQPSRQVLAGEAGRRRQFQIAVGEVGHDALLVLVQRIRAGRVRVPEGDRLRNPPGRELRGIRLGRLPGPVRRLVVHHQEERLVAWTVLQKVERQFRDDIGRILTRIGLLPACRVEHGIVVDPLARQDLPSIEADGIASKVPLADHPGVVAALPAAAARPSCASCRTG